MSTVTHTKDSAPKPTKKDWDRVKKSKISQISMLYTNLEKSQSTANWMPM